ncbi:MAG: bifunctional [glutamate--ammonia ligase]-adenylyl-L-tyrosine phosphorylase/[glutamate--ammonia-ligase] adenylyltransferase [Ignavibacteria bacterium]
MTLPAAFPQCSRYVARMLENRPELASEVAGRKPWPLRAEELRAWLFQTPLDEPSLKPALRRLKQRAFAHIAAQDLDGRAALADVTEAMTALADVTVAAALDVLSAAQQERYGIPRNAAGAEQKLIVVGMGKLGGRELNVSSDIDLIFVYPEDGETDGTRPISNFEYFTRLGRALINALAESTGDGRVFRVDMRLRPDGDSGPLACSFDMLENYFVTQGREWERYAWIKARPLTGDRHDELDALRQPFVFRKYLDFGTIDAMRGLHAQIRREVAKKDMANNIKLGPGGIREIEFIAQVFQLIRGGRDRALQIKPTLRVLRMAAERGHLTVDAVNDLTTAYDFLRRLEHRLQYLDDAQTHSLPENADDQALIALAMGFSSYEALLAELDDHRQNVSRHFEAVFSDPNEPEHALDSVWSDADGHADELARLGFKDVASACQRLAGVRAGTRYQQLSDVARNRFDTLVPRVIQAAAQTADPDATLARCLDLLEAVSRRAAYLSLLLEYPQALAKLAEIAGSSSWAASYLLRHPILLDELLDARSLEAPPDWPAFRGELDGRLEEAEPDTERQMDIMREAHHAQVFRLLAQDLAGLLPLERLSDHLSELADIVLDLTVTYAWRKLLRRHRDKPRFAVISYGKLGGKELGYASDLDMIFLFDDDHPDAAQIYSKLAMRIITWLDTRTSAGQLFETDLRLRPNGDSGLVVTSLEAFRQYQLESAWMWEHQALTRARFSAGDAGIGEGFEAIRDEVLRKRRDLADLKREVRAMRQKMYDAHAGKSELFDLKQDPGGLIDVEFIVQALVLGHAADHPELTANRGNIALLRMAAEKGLIPAPLAESVRDAYREYRRMQHALRLNSQKSRIDPALVADKAEAVRALWKYVFD